MYQNMDANLTKDRLVSLIETQQRSLPRDILSLIADYACCTWYAVEIFLHPQIYTRNGEVSHIGYRYMFVIPSDYHPLMDHALFEKINGWSTSRRICRDEKVIGVVIYLSALRYSHVCENIFIHDPTLMDIHMDSTPYSVRLGLTILNTFKKKSKPSRDRRICRRRFDYDDDVICHTFDIHFTMTRLMHRYQHTQKILYSL
jgi:hypothetical protein